MPTLDHPTPSFHFCGSHRTHIKIPKKPSLKFFNLVNKHQMSALYRTLIYKTLYQTLINL